MRGVMKFVIGSALVLASIIVVSTELYQDGISKASVFASIMTLAVFGGIGCLLIRESIRE